MYKDQVTALWKAESYGYFTICGNLKHACRSLHTYIYFEYSSSTKVFLVKHFAFQEVCREIDKDIQSYVEYTFYLLWSP